ncbi:MAG: dihydrofolate reductase family protein [Egibacteraceae bacterium]
MAKVVTGASMSLDGFIADPADGVEHLFGWYVNGDVAVPTADPRMVFRTSEASAGVIREMIDDCGALVVGRREFDVARGYNGRHPMGVPVFVVTHEVPAGWPRADAPFTFVTDGVESAVEQAKAVAGDRTVGVGPGSIARQCLDAGLLDEVRVDLVPVLLGDGIRFFANLAKAPVAFDTPRVVEGTGVTHLLYRVRGKD